MTLPMQQNYSPEHVAAFRRWQTKGSLGISEADVIAIQAEDEAHGRFIRRERDKQRQKQMADAEGASRESARVATKAAAVPAKKLDPVESLKGFQRWSDLVRAYIDDELPMTTEAERQKAFADIFQYKPVFRTMVLLPIMKYLRSMNERTDRIKALEDRLTQLESRPELKFMGPWRDDSHYGSGCLVQKNAALWLATKDSIAASPGTAEGSDCWRLVVKSGVIRADAR